MTEDNYAETMGNVDVVAAAAASADDEKITDCFNLFAPPAWVVASGINLMQ